MYFDLGSFYFSLRSSQSAVVGQAALKVGQKRLEEGLECSSVVWQRPRQIKASDLDFKNTTEPVSDSSTSTSTGGNLIRQSHRLCH